MQTTNKRDRIAHHGDSDIQTSSCVFMVPEFWTQLECMTSSVDNKIKGKRGKKKKMVKIIGETEVRSRLKGEKNRKVLRLEKGKILWMRCRLKKEAIGR